MPADLINLFLGFLRASNLAFGGGPAVIPFLKTEAVDKYGWMTIDQFSDAVAVCSSLPGPIATNLASYIGNMVASWPGVLVAILATILPTILILILAQKLLEKYAGSKGLKGMLKGIRPVVAALLIVVTMDMARSAFLISAPLDLATLAIAIIAGFLLFRYRTHPVFLVVGSLIAGYAIW